MDDTLVRALWAKTVSKLSPQRLTHLIAMWQSGELARLAAATPNQDVLATRLGMSARTFRAAIVDARDMGHAIPPYATLRQAPLTVSAPSVNDRLQIAGEWDEEPTCPHVASAQADIGKPDNSFGPRCNWCPSRGTVRAAIRLPDDTVRPEFVENGRKYGMAYWSCEECIAPLDWLEILEREQPKVETPDIAAEGSASRRGATSWARPDEDYAAWDAKQQPIAQPQQQPIASRWPHLEAFDAVGGNDMLPAHGPGVRRSTLLDAETGKPRLQWIINKGGQDSNQIIDACLRAFGEMPRNDRAAPPQDSNDDLLACYPIGDAHVGMLAWAPETGDNFDLRIAERNLLAAVKHLVDIAPPAKRALVINIGDFVHSDGPKPATAKGTPVDVDGRWPKVIETAIRALRCMVDAALAKHEHVTVVNARGNHDETSALIIAIALAQFYENNPRVHIDRSPEFFHWYRFEQNLIGITHSHTTRTPHQLLGVMVVDRAKDWGETKHRRYYCGHLHHQIVKEEATLICEWIPTLAGLDAWHRGQGYRAVRELRCDVFHARRGMIHRLVVGIDHVHELVAEAA